MANGISKQGQEGREYQDAQAKRLRESDITRSLNEAYRKRFGGQPQQDPRDMQRQETAPQRPMPDQQMPERRDGWDRPVNPSQPAPGGGMVDPSAIVGELDQSDGSPNPEWEREYYLKILGILGLLGQSGAPGPVGPNGYAAPGNGMNTFRFGPQGEVHGQLRGEPLMDQRREQEIEQMPPAREEWRLDGTYKPYKLGPGNNGPQKSFMDELRSWDESFPVPDWLRDSLPKIPY